MSFLCGLTGFKRAVNGGAMRYGAINGTSPLNTVVTRGRLSESGGLSVVKRHAQTMAKATLIGHVGADPQVHLFNQGSVTTFSVAINNLKGDKQLVTEWYRVCVYNDYLQELARRFVTKGSRVYMEGTLRNRQWKDGLGNDRNTVEIHLKYAADLIVLSRTEGDHSSISSAAYKHSASEQRQSASIQDGDAQTVESQDQPDIEESRHEAQKGYTSQ